MSHSPPQPAPGATGAAATGSAGKSKSPSKKTKQQQQQQQYASPNRSQPKPAASPPFGLYADETKASSSPSSPSFAEGWASVVKLLQGRKNIAVLTGAGISVSCGIPDFRSKESGLYATLDTAALGLSCPEDLFDAHFFAEDPGPFYKFARQLYFPLGTGEDEEHPKRVRPSDSHKLLAHLEQKKVLLRVYSQNIDGLEEEAGVSSRKVCYAHGSLQWATCSVCKKKVTSKEIEGNILAGTVPYCQAPTGTAGLSSPLQSSNTSAVVGCPSPATPTRTPSLRAAAVSSRKRSRSGGSIASLQERTIGRNGEAVCGGVMKPGVTFFGEALHNTVKSKLESDRAKVDALIVIGTSLSVAPISKVIGYLPKNIPRILINRTIVHPPEQHDDEDDGTGSSDSIEFRDNYVFDAYLLGYCDNVTRALGKCLFPNPNEASATPGMDAELEGELLAEVMKGSAATGTPSSYSAAAWKSVSVPRDRVFLFPGAEAPTGVSEKASFCEIAHCDGCSKQIEGTIQKCIVCFDFDLCQACYPTLSRTHYNGMHQFTEEMVDPAT